MDFMSDALFDGPASRLQTVVDCCSREGLATVPRANFRAFNVVEVARASRPRTGQAEDHSGRQRSRVCRTLARSVGLSERCGSWTSPGGERQPTMPSSKPSTPVSGPSASTPAGSSRWPMPAIGSRRGESITTPSGLTRPESPDAQGLRSASSTRPKNLMTTGPDSGARPTPEHGLYPNLEEF